MCMPICSNVDFHFAKNFVATPVSRGTALASMPQWAAITVHDDDNDDEPRRLRQPKRRHEQRSKRRAHRSEGCIGKCPACMQFTLAVTGVTGLLLLVASRMPWFNSHGRATPGPSTQNVAASAEVTMFKGFSHAESVEDADAVAIHLFMQPQSPPSLLPRPLPLTLPRPRPPIPSPAPSAPHLPTRHLIVPLPSQPSPAAPRPPRPHMPLAPPPLPPLPSPPPPSRLPPPPSPPPPRQYICPPGPPCPIASFIATGECAGRWLALLPACACVRTLRKRVTHAFTYTAGDTLTNGGRKMTVGGQSTAGMTGGPRVKYAHPPAKTISLTRWLVSHVSCRGAMRQSSSS